MHLYLSSYRIGTRGAELAHMLGPSKHLAVIRNAVDFSSDTERHRSGRERERAELASLGISSADVDLRDYFGSPQALRRDLLPFAGLWVVGGNTFVLRRAMALSGLDTILREHADNDAFTYAGYSAGACVLSPTLRGIHLADEPEMTPPGYTGNVLWDGLGLIPFCIAPHFRSNHPESPLIESVVQYYVEAGTPFITLRDGETYIGKAGQGSNASTSDEASDR